jgi:hypothetical protein
MKVMRGWNNQSGEIEEEGRIILKLFPGLANNKLIGDLIIYLVLS